MGDIFNYFKENTNMVWVIAICILFAYSLIYSLLQVRELRMLQGKVQTQIDPLLRMLSYIYLFIQIIIFVVALVIL